MTDFSFDGKTVVKWMVVVDHDGEQANTLFDVEADARCFAELLETRSSFHAVCVRKITLPDAPVCGGFSADVGS